MTDNDESGVIDITNLAESMRETFVTWATGFVIAQAVATPGFQWLAFPVIDIFFKAVVTWILNVLTLSAVMGSFFLNTSLRKSSQAQDYLAALTAKNNLPPTASDDEYEKAEQAEIAAFNSFVVLGN